MVTKAGDFISSVTFYSVIKYDTIYCCIPACLFLSSRQVEPLRVVTHFSVFFSGKILNDDTALKEYKINEKNFVVVMVTKVWELQIVSVNGRVFFVGAEFMFFLLL